MAVNKRLADDNLEVLGLAVRPTSLADLQSAFRKAMTKAHPDMGGTNEAARIVMMAYDELARNYGRRSGSLKKKRL